MKPRNVRQIFTDMFAKFFDFCTTVRDTARKEEERLRFQIRQEMRSPADTTRLEARFENLQQMDKKIN